MKFSGQTDFLNTVSRFFSKLIPYTDLLLIKSVRSICSTRWIVLVVGTGLVTLSVRAASYTWTGPTGADWGNAANWSPSTGYPNGTNDVVLITNNHTLNFSNGITSGVFGYLTNACPVAGNAVLGASAQTNVFLTAAVTAGSPLISVTNSSGNLYFYAQLSGTQGFTKAGNGKLTFRFNPATNPFSGTINVNAGTLGIEHDGSLGYFTNGVTIANSTRLLLEPGTNTGTYPLAASRIITLKGALARIGVTPAAVHLVVNCPITQDAAGRGLNKVDTGKVTLAGPLSYSGETRISAGTLIFNSTNLFSGPVNVVAGTLAGTGLISGSVTNGTNGTLSPGNYSIGTLTVNNSLTLHGTNYFEFRVDDPFTTPCDRIKGITTLTYGGTLTVTNLGTIIPTAGNSFKLFEAATYTGAFQATHLPPLPAHLSWDYSQLSTSGYISVGYTPDATNPLLAQAESTGFTVDTRMSGTDEVNGLLTTQASLSFTLDTRIVSGSVFSGESGAFSIDTRLENPALLSLLVSNSSPAFTIDTRVDFLSRSLLSSNVSSAFTVDTRLAGSDYVNSLIISQTSPCFPLNTRLEPDTNLITRFEFGPFTLNTVDFFASSPAQVLGNTNGGGTGGKIRFSPDGFHLAKTDANRLMLWNLLALNRSYSLGGHTGDVATVEFSPMGDQLLSGGTDGTLRWWDAGARNQLGLRTSPGVGTVQSAFSSDGARTIAARGTNVTVYRTADMQSVQQLATDDGAITAVAICPEGVALAGTSTRAVYVWDTATGLLLHRLGGHDQMITACAIFTGGSNALTASIDGTIRVWNLNSGNEILVIHQGSAVADAALSADGRVIASCNSGTPGTAYLWDAQTGDMLRYFSDATSQASQTKGVAVSPDHTLLATTHVDGQVRLWNTRLTPSLPFTLTSLPSGTNFPVTLRSHGLYYFKVDEQVSGSVVISLKANSPAFAAKAMLVSGTQTATTITEGVSSDALFANVDAAAPSSSPLQFKALAMKPAPVGTDITGFCLAGTKGRLPSAYDYDAFTQASVTNLYCEMPLANSTSSDVYVLVFAPYLAAGSINATIRADFTPFHLSSVSPARGGNSGSVTARIMGTGITPDTTASLINGNVTIPGQVSLFADSTKAWFTFALSNAAPGSYQIQITKPGMSPVVLDGTFQIVSAVGPLLQSSLSAPSAVRPGRDYVTTLKYANVGDVDMAAPLFVVADADQRASLYPINGRQTDIVDPSAPISGNKVSQLQILGMNQDGPPGIIPPGASFELPLYFQGDGGAWNMTYNLSALKADATPITWTNLEASLRPADMAADLWAALWSSFKASVGTNWADYLRALDTQASLLNQAGQSTYDPAEMLAAMFSRAIGTSYRRTLAAAVDAQAVAPALPLSFTRFIMDGLEQRFTMGSLGRGWSHNYEYDVTLGGHVIIFSDGPLGSSGNSYYNEWQNTVIRTPGGGMRTFSPIQDRFPRFIRRDMDKSCGGWRDV